jgi:hypothetical protein
MALPRDKYAFERLNEAFARMARAGGFAASSFDGFAKFYTDSISRVYGVNLTDIMEEAWEPSAKQLAAVSRVQNETRQVFDCEECTKLARTVWVPRLCARRDWVW